MERQYKPLDAEERGVILAEHRRESSLRQIGRPVGRHHSTIGLELVRGAVPGGYVNMPCQVIEEAESVCCAR